MSSVTWKSEYQDKYTYQEFDSSITMTNYPYHPHYAYQQTKRPLAYRRVQKPFDLDKKLDDFYLTDYTDHYIYHRPETISKPDRYFGKNSAFSSGPQAIHQNTTQLEQTAMSPDSPMNFKETAARNIVHVRYDDPKVETREIKEDLRPTLKPTERIDPSDPNYPLMKITNGVTEKDWNSISHTDHAYPATVLGARHVIPKPRSVESQSLGVMAGFSSTYRTDYINHMEFLKNSGNMFPKSRELEPQSVKTAL